MSEWEGFFFKYELCEILSSKGIDFVPVVHRVFYNAFDMAGAEDHAVLLGTIGCLIELGAHVRVNEGVVVAVHEQCRC